MLQLLPALDLVSVLLRHDVLTDVIRAISPVFEVFIAVLGEA